MRKKFAAAVTILAVLAVSLFLLCFIGTGLVKATSVYIWDYSVAEDGREITLDIAVASSIGYVRKAEVSQQHGGKLYIDFYAAFGGINGRVGAKSSFTLPLDEDTTMIAIYQAENCYEEALRRDADGVWQLIPPAH